MNSPMLGTPPVYTKHDDSDHRRQLTEKEKQMVDVPNYPFITLEQLLFGPMHKLYEGGSLSCFETDELARLYLVARCCRPGRFYCFPDHSVPLTASVPFMHVNPGNMCYRAKNPSMVQSCNMFNAVLLGL
jgi:hypothetical protein